MSEEVSSGPADREADDDTPQPSSFEAAPQHERTSPAPSLAPAALSGDELIPFPAPPPVAAVAFRSPIANSLGSPAVAYLDPETRAAFDRAAVEPGAQRRILELLGKKDKLSRDMLGRILDRFTTPSTDPTTLPLDPAASPIQPLTFAELVRGIAETHDPIMVRSFADRCATHFGTAKDQRLFSQFRIVAEGIAVGSYDPDEVIRVAEAAFGRDVLNCGAYFWQSLKNSSTAFKAV